MDVKVPQRMWLEVEGNTHECPPNNGWRTFGVSYPSIRAVVLRNETIGATRFVFEYRNGQYEWVRDMDFDGR